MNLLWTLRPTSGSPAFSGRRANNAIPRDARTVLLLDKPGRTTLDRVAADVHEWSAHGVLARTTKRSSRSSQRTNPPPTRVTSPDAARGVDLLVALPSGVLSTDERFSGIVRTSTNLGVAYIEDDEALLVSAPRSSRRTDLDALHPRYAGFARLGGGGAIVISEYPAWPPGLQSALLEVVHAAHLEVRGRAPHVTTVHAGLEAGEIAAHVPGLVSRLSQRFPRWGHAVQHLHEQSFGSCICVRHNADVAKSVAECCRRHAASVCDAYASRRTRASRHYVNDNC
jgi:dipeptidase D